MADRPASLRPAVLVTVDGTGTVHTRPTGGLPATDPLVGYLQAAARRTPVPAMRFLWLHDARRGDTPDPWLRRVDIAPGPAPATCVAEIATVTRTDVDGLTGRELQVLTLLACGLTNPAIADRLGVSRRTIATHIERLHGKLRVTSRASAAAIAVDRSLAALPLPPGPVDDYAPMSIVALENAVRNSDERRAPDRVRRSTTPGRRPFLIGSVYPSDPAWRVDGLEMERGAGLAVAEVNRRGGVAGRRVEQVSLHVDLATPGSVAGALRTLVDSDVDAITMGYLLDRDRASLTQQLSAVASTGCPVLHHSTSATAAALVEDAPDVFGNLFQVCAPETTYGLGFVRCLTDLRNSGAWRPRSRRLLVVDATAPGLTTFPGSAADAAERNGWQVSVEHVDLLEPDWALILDRVASLDPAAVMAACFVPDRLADLVRRLAASGTEALLYALYAPSVSSFLPDAGPAAEGMLWATVTGVYRDRFGREFADLFRARFGSEPGLSSSGIHFDMTTLLVAAWNRCRSPHDLREVGTALRAGVHRGVNGAYQLGSRGQTGLSYPDTSGDASLAQAHLVFQVQDGTHRIIAPTGFADAAFRRPAKA